MQGVENQNVSVDVATLSNTTVVSKAKILLSLLKTNPFGKLTTDDLNKEKTPPFSVFRGKTDLYSFPASQSEAKTRVQDNVSYFIGNYIAVFVIFFLFSLYTQPIQFLILVAVFPVTDYVDSLIVKKGLDQSYPFLRRFLFFTSKLGITALLMRVEVVISFFLSLLAAYLAMLLHGAMRKLRD